jgi:hypothetical protein
MLQNPDFGLCVNDSVIFKVDITVFGELEPISMNNEVESKEHHYKNCLEGSLQQIFNDEASSDVRIFVGEDKQVIYAHRCILIARSEMFNLMFSSAMRESTTGEIHITDFEFQVIRSMIFYMYTDTFPDQKVLAQHAINILKASKKYMISSLTEYCELYLANCLTVSSCLSMLRFAYDMDTTILRQKCLIYIAQNSPKVIQLPEYNELEKELSTDVSATIEAFNKRKGCRKLYDKKSKYAISCHIM